MTGTPDTELILIDDVLWRKRVEPPEYDLLLSEGFRHFGKRFERYSLSVYAGEIQRVIPLRVDLEKFRLSKSQRRTLAKNSDVGIEMRPISITPETEILFRAHSTRFREQRPDSIRVFLSDDPSRFPTDGMELRVIVNGAPIAISFFDMSTEGLSAIYAMFHPAYEHRRLGIFTMLKEIEHAVAQGKKYYYLGYAFDSPSFYDYKKRFSGLEVFDWKGNWLPWDG